MWQEILLTDYDGIEIHFQQMIFHNETDLRTVFIMNHGDEEPTHEEVDLSLAGADSYGIKERFLTFAEHGVDMHQQVRVNPSYYYGYDESYDHDIDSESFLGPDEFRRRR